MTGFRNIFHGPESSESSAFLDEARLEEALSDAALMALAAELAELGDTPVPPSARQRGLALVHEEFERREQGIFGAALGRGLLFRGRLALGSVAVVLAAFLGLVGLYGGGDSPQWTGSTGSGGSSATPGTSGPDGSGTTASSSQAPGLTGTSVPGTTIPEGTTAPTAAPTTTPAPGNATTVTTSPTTATSMRPPASSTSTSKPSVSTSTTSRAVMTREQREKSAAAVARSLSEKVVLNEPEAAAALLAGSAGTRFVQLVSSLEAPYGYEILSISTTDGPNTRVLVEFLDLVSTDEGLADVTARFYYEMKVDASGARVTDIYKAPAR